MKSVKLLAAVMAFTAFAPLAASAGEKSTETYEKKSNVPASQQRKVTLEVQSVDRANHSVTFKAHVSPEANLEENGVPIKIDQLQPGDSIRASFDPKTGDVIKAEVTRSQKDQGQKAQDQKKDQGQMKDEGTK